MMAPFIIPAVQGLSMSAPDARALSCGTAIRNRIHQRGGSQDLPGAPGRSRASRGTR